MSIAWSLREKAYSDRYQKPRAGTIHSLLNIIYHFLIFVIFKGVA